MKHFTDKYHELLTGSISGWDRMFFRGSIRWLSNSAGLSSYLAMNHILMKDFKDWAMKMTNQVRQSCDALADIWGIRKVYLRSSSQNKEELARKIAQEDGIQTGPICMFSVVEPCWSPWVFSNAGTKKLEVTARSRKCVWIYFYWNDERTGFGHLRLQSWLPFTIKGCLNGRHWLERQLIKEQIGYIKDGNCFRWIEDPIRAQELSCEQLKTDWADLLEGWRKRYFGIVDELFEHDLLEYYWSADQTEWATDLMFRNTSDLDRLFPQLARYGLLIGDSANILRFLGKIGRDAPLPKRVSGQIRGDRRQRYEGVRVKHWAGHNSVKTYNKAGNVLRVETGINDTRAFKVYRETDGQPSWQLMRKGIADMHRRAEISQKSNERYLDALSACDHDSTLLEQLEGVCRKVKKDRTARALNPWSEMDHQLLCFLAKGQWSVNGLRNRDLCAHLNPKAHQLNDEQRKRLSAKASRLLRMLRTHGLIRKQPRSYRYIVTKKGQQVAALVLAASQADTQALMKIAA